MPESSNHFKTEGTKFQAGTFRSIWNLNFAPPPSFLALKWVAVFNKPIKAIPGTSADMITRDLRTGNAYTILFTHTFKACIE